MSQDRQFEQLVSTIADRVRAELARQGQTSLGVPARSSAQDGAGHGHSHGHTGGHGPGTPCKAGKGECIGCGWSISRRPDDVAKIVDLGAQRVSAAPGLDAAAVRQDLARYIDHTLLKANASRDDFKKLCEEARKYKFASVCVNAANVGYCARELRGSGVPVVAVVGFPLGATTPAAKAFETREAVRDGAEEIDMVINIGALKSKDYALVLADIQAVVGAAGGKKVKVILETGELTRDEKIVSCALSKIAGAAFVKTSTGFGPGGATADDVALMKAIVGDELEVKASGGMRTSEDVDKMLQAGATRIGASASVAIVRGTAPKVEAGKPQLRRVGGY
ncbi:MAG: deoxyribose-phosphate aldolase [Deltaproteobacteria bacterium]|nr:deoxyribose-phosphate aldolase [Deltaproteobacteria bacterium]